MDEALLSWIAAHPYLRYLARFQAIVDEAVAAVPPPRLAPARLDAYAPEHDAGVPLLHSAAAALDLAPAREQLAQVVARVAEGPAPEKLRAEGAALVELLGAPAARAEAVAFVCGLAGPGAAGAQAGLLRFLGWSTLRATLAPVLREYATWREAAASARGDAPWLRGECPTCGAAPLMAQLSGVDEGHRRQLACGCCGTTWGFRRIGCPFCGNDALDRLRVLEVEGEPRLRIDTCEGCGGYLKTYAGNGEERTFLADWTTLHLDVLARERGLKRVGASLYDL